MMHFQMNDEDVKVLFLNAMTFLLSFAEIEVILKIALLLISIGYTLYKWIALYQSKNGKRKH